MGTIILLSVLAAPAAAQEPMVIVNAENPAGQITREALVAIFTGHMTRWKDSRPIAAVDQSVSTPVRAAFSEKLLGQSLMAIQRHWHIQLSTGRSVPPRVKGSDAEVVAYVRQNPAAIGYVTDGAPLEGVKALKVVD